MGMASSQARLLTLTSRMHDVEYKAQNIESQKIQLATQKDELYQEYTDALDKKKIQVKMQNGIGYEYIDANFSTLCDYNPDRLTQYTLTDSKTGRIYVSDEVARMYKECDTDKYSFAWCMLGMDHNFSKNDIIRYSKAEVGQGNEIGFNINDDSEDGKQMRFMTDTEREAFKKYKDTDGHANITSAYNKLIETRDNPDSTDSEKREALSDFRKALYEDTQCRNEIYDNMRKITNADDGSYDNRFDEEFPYDEFQYYIHLFEQIKEAGGCVAMKTEYMSGDDGTEWFNNMVTSGKVLISAYNNRKKCWEETSVATSTSGNNLQSVSDEKDLKKIEAEYEHNLDIINQKDKKFDMDLKKLDTERTAIKTEMDAVKQVRNDNEERTFGIFG